MNTRIVIKEHSNPIYDILLNYDYQNLVKECNFLDLSNKKVCIVTDSTVSNYYLHDLVSTLTGHIGLVETFVFPDGELSKNLNTVNSLYHHLILHRFDRKDILIALGGGVVGDLTGFCAATYLRGISFIQIPTTLLSMVDSSIGGKTGVDFESYKNMVGAFHQPKLVYMNIQSLMTLNETQYFSGLGEIIKHGLIQDKEYFQYLKNSIDLINRRDMNTLCNIIHQSCVIKGTIVEKDPKELGDRALLNFGHTIGHAVEKLLEFKLLHGECVALGMVAASYLSYRKSMITKDELDDIITLIQAFQLPIHVSGVTKEDVFHVIAHDKKQESGKLKFILLSAIGNGIIDTSLSQSELLDAIDFIICK